MKRLALSLFAVALLSPGLAAAQSGYYDEGDRYAYDRENVTYAYADVLRVDPIYEMVRTRVPEERCGDQVRDGGDPTGGTIVGAIVGGALGNQVGKGDGRKAATIAGAVAGGAIGHSIEKDRRRSNYSHRISVRMDRDGRVRTYDQYDTYGLRRGDRVYISRGEVVPAR